MHEPTRFGGFLLLKKLSEDPLGESYRAGRIEGSSVGEIVLLRTYSLADAGSELAEILREATGPSHRIQGPGLTYALAGGEVGGVPYAVYDYTTGWSLLHLIESAGAGFAQLERDHGLLIVERLAKGLAVVHQADSSQARTHHGFVAPQNVRLSSEGDIALMGFETGPFLARIVARGGLTGIHPFVSPEVRSGVAPTPSDDVYSLGAILWQLLIGQPPPLDTASGLAASLHKVRLRGGEVLPGGLGELLQSSLAPRRFRFQDANQWYQILSEWMGRNQVTTTHFDLAFFIHEIFRTAIRKEEEEVEKERQLDLAPDPAGPSPPPEADGPEVSDIILRPDLSGMVQRPPIAAQMTEVTPAASSERERSTSPTKAVLLGLAAMLLVAIAGGWYWLSRSALQAPDPPPVQAPPPLPAAPAPPSAELQIAQDELERLVQEKARGLSDQIAAEYDEQIRSLRRQLRAAQEAETQAIVEAARRNEESRRNEASLSEAAPENAGEAAPENAGEAARPPTAGVDAGAEPAPPAVEPPADGSEDSPVPPNAPPPAAPEPESARSPDATPPGGSPTPGESPATGGAGTAAGESPPPSVAPKAGEDAPPEAVASPRAAPPPTAAAPPPREAVKPPRRIRLPEPRYPERARQYRKEATVLIKVLVGTDGKVIDAQPVIDQPDTFGFIQEAIRAARGAEFSPAVSGGLPVRMWTTVVISFKLK